MTDQPTDKAKLLAWGDYGCSTGFATVMSNIMCELEATGRYDLTVVGINYTGDPINVDRFPGKVWPAMPGSVNGNSPYADVYGRQRLLDMAGSGDYDVLFLLQDTFILQTIMPQLIETQEAMKEQGRPFKIVYYFPIDATPKKEWITEVIAKIDYPVVYTNYGLAEVKKFDEKLDIPVIYHGTNLHDFFYIEDRDSVAKFRQAYFQGIADGRFLIMNLNRNQPRKDIVRTLMVVAELKKRGLKPLLYMHMQHDDVGGNIFVMADQLGLQNEVDFITPHPKSFTANQGIPIARLNLLYNAVDCVITTTLGEGWGLSVTEAFATKTPLVGPNNTSLTEMLANNRGILVDSGTNPSAWIMKENDLERIRPLTDVEDAAAKIADLMDPTTTSTVDLEAAHAWAAEHSWENIVRTQWLPIIDTAADTILHPEKYMSRQERRAWDRKQAKLATKAAGL